MEQVNTVNLPLLIIRFVKPPYNKVIIRNKILSYLCVPDLRCIPACCQIAAFGNLIRQAMVIKDTGKRYYAICCSMNNLKIHSFLYSSCDNAADFSLTAVRKTLFFADV